MRNNVMEVADKFKDVNGRLLFGSRSFYILVAALLLLSMAMSVSLGATHIPFENVWKIIINKLIPGSFVPNWPLGQELVVWDIRLPRSLLACFTGAGLALVGVVLQSVTRNPLADPHLLGISSGGAFGAILALLHTGYFLGPLTVPILAFAGACLATILVLGLAHLAGADSASRLVLVGVAVSFVIMSLANLLIFFGDPRATHSVVFWMLGGLGLAQWNHLIYPSVVLCCCAVYFLCHSSQLNGLLSGDETATTLGIPVTRFRLMIFVVGALLTGVMVAYTGMIGFVGLMMPHIARGLVGGDNRKVLPLAALLGSLFLLWADITARTVMAPEEIPIGIVTGLIGGLFFLWLLQRRRL